MRIVQIAAEFAPLAKAGGLGEVLLGLSRELSLRHHAVEMILPKYSFIHPKSFNELQMDRADFRIQEKGQSISNTIWRAVAEDCRLSLIEAHHPQGYFHRDKIYGYPDDVVRFLYFCKAAMEYLASQAQPIDVLHLHDWHTAVCAVLARDRFYPQLKIGTIIFTIHNLEYQGKCATWDLDAIGLQGASYLKQNKLQDPDPLHPQTINLLKGGLTYADAVTTVSPTYAKEILTPRMGFGLSKMLQAVRPTGILNGIDTTIWNPEKDPYLARHFCSNDSLARINQAKRANKEALEQRLSRRFGNRPLVGVISRLIPQKGTSLIQKAIQQILDAGGTFALLGSQPGSELQKEFNELKLRYQNHPEVLLQYDYDDSLAHLLYGAFDFILVPSLFEPCGLTQLIALRYGALPIVRSTGGLKDTVFDCEDSSVPHEKRNGFIFQKATAAALHNCILRALHLWTHEQATYQNLVRQALSLDYSWNKSAQEYLKLYRSRHPERLSLCKDDSHTDSLQLK